MDALTDARDLVAERFPNATWAILTGSVLGPDRAAGSDLDIVVLREEEPGYRESLNFRLLRELRELDPAFAARWLAARDEPAALAAEVLARAGGPLFEGYRM